MPVIEFLSPINKKAGKEREGYLEKRATYLDSNTHLIEIDLLRRFRRMPLKGSLAKSDYLLVVSNAYEPPSCDVWPIQLRERLPVLPIPLIRPDDPVSLESLRYYALPTSEHATTWALTTIPTGSGQAWSLSDFAG